MEFIAEYIYVGKLIHNSDCLLPELNRKIKIAWEVFGRNSIIFKTRMALICGKGHLIIAYYRHDIPIRNLDTIGRYNTETLNYLKYIGRELKRQLDI